MTVVGFGVLLGGCAELPPPAVPTLLTHLEAWQVVQAADDPLYNHRPVVVDCPAGAWGSEDGLLEVQTGACNYFAVAQPLPVSLAPGDVVRWTAYHAGLDGTGTGEAHAALWADDVLLWEVYTSIPHDAQVWSVEIVVTADVPEGAPIGLHLHNHGFNSWGFTDLEHEPQGWDP